MKTQVYETDRLLEAVKKFPKLRDNLCATATDQDRREATRAILSWWNSEIVLILAEIRRERG